VILLDTHVLLWISSDPQRLSKNAREAIREARQTASLAVATITLWELAWLAQNGRLVISSSPENFVMEAVSRVVLEPMTPQIVALAARLPASFPKDPADRVITATAILEGIPLVTADQRIRDAGIVEIIW
jgi:PIN domain nuclease of toxin-antitoxin system